MAQDNGTQIRASRTTDNRSGTTSPGTLDPYKRLAAAVLAQAARDAKAGDMGAALWLLSPAAEFLADEVGLSFVHVQRWAHKVQFLAQN